MLGTGIASAQGAMDAAKLGSTELNGTARYLGMAGAFGALGGDISVMKDNPAGLAVYRSSEVATTLSLNASSAKSNFMGSVFEDDKTKLSFDNIAYVGYFPTGQDEGILSWNVGFSYNKTKNFNKNFGMAGVQDYSMSDFIANRTNGAPFEDISGKHAYEKSNWLSALGYAGGLIEHYNRQPGETKDRYYSPFGNMDDQGRWTPYKLENSRLAMQETGSIDQYAVSAGTNISDFLMLGASLLLTDIDYNLSSIYDETFENGNNLYLDNQLTTTGSGYGVNIGAILKPVDYLRLGVAYNSPTWYKMTDYYYAEAGSHLTYTEHGEQKELKLDAKTPYDPDPRPYTDYQFTTPDKWLFSAAAIVGKYALISVDYELTNYQNMRMKDYQGYANQPTNEDIKHYFRNSSTVRVGVEMKPTPQFSIRAGYSYANSPIKTEFGNAINAHGDVQTEVRTIGTVPHFTIDKGVTNYTFGIGYRFTPQFYTDIACVLRTHKEDLYAFSMMPLDEKQGYEEIVSEAASLKTKNTRVALTFGYKF